MKPALTLYDGGGHHNADLAAAHSRILADGSWKKQRIVVIVPAGDTISTRCYLSHRNIAFPPNQQVVWIAAEGMEVGRAYSQAIESILDHPELGKWEYILTLEHDNLPQPDGVLRLIRRMEENPHLSCIGGLYWTKGYGGVPQIWGDPRDPVVNFRPQPPDLNGGLVECCGTGMGFNLWRMSMFRHPELRRPWFETKDGCTQDLYFWSDARKYGFRCAIDCGVRVGHYDHAGTFGEKGKVW